MNQQELTEAVLQEVLHRLAISAPDKVVLGGALTGYRTFDAACTAKTAAQALIISLSPWSMVNLANGSACNREEAFILEMLLLNKPVYLRESALIYRQYKDTSPKGLYQKYLQAEKTLAQIGIVLEHDVKVSHEKNKRKLITADVIEQLIADEQKILVVNQQTLITPLAQELLKTAGIAVRKEED